MATASGILASAWPLDFWPPLSFGRGPLLVARKYKNQPEWVGDRKFDSKAEANRYRELVLLERANEIANLECQPVYPLEIPRLIDGKLQSVPVKIRSDKRPNGTRTKYTADFRYQDKRTGRQIVEDVKGVDTTASRLRRAVVEAIYGIEIVLIRAKATRKRR